MMKLLRTLVIVSMLAAGFAFFPTVQNASAACVSLSGNGDSDVWIGPFSMDDGSSVTVTMETTSGGGTAISIWVDGSLEVDSVKYTTPHTVTYTLAADAEVGVVLNWEYNGQAENSYNVSTSDCGVNPIIPAQAVSGAFVEKAEIYYEPGKLVAPLTYVDPGKTFLVAGQDATGAYRKVLIACQWVWVRAETVGPNFDDVWEGKPLPTTIVEVEPSTACPAGSPPIDVPVRGGEQTPSIIIAE